MIEAHILDGDIAIIRPQHSVACGQIAAVTVEGDFLEATLKIFRRKENRIELHPANANYQPLFFEASECSLVRVIGKFIGIIRRTL